MYDRNLKSKLIRSLDINPAVALTGPRQVGKTTLAHEIVKDRNALYLDLERPRDLAKVTDIEQFCQANTDQLLVLDEVQRAPEIFAPLRSIIDERRRAGRKTGQFLLLGSASMELLKQSGETLAGRIAYLELFPLDAWEVPATGQDRQKLWVRGGFPESYLAADDEDSLDWRLDFIRTYLERDIPQLGPRIPAETLRRFWTMLAHSQGATLNAASLARGLGVSGVTIGRYLDLLVDLLLVRRIQPWVSNMGKRLVRSPKVYVRDSGITHSLLGIESFNDLFGHPVSGASWEGFVIENLLSILPRRALYGFYRTVGGAEIDLIIEIAGERLAIEIKSNLAPKVSKGFHIGCADLEVTRKYIVHGGDDTYPMGNGIQAVSLVDMMKEIQCV